MNYKISCHLMPYELDYALLSYIQLKKAKHYLDPADNIYVDVTLNLSSYLINWSDSKLQKDFFIDKFNQLKHLLSDYHCRFDVYDGNELFGGLNTQINSTEDHIDYYMVLNPDMYFDEKALYYLIEASKSVNHKYLIISQQIPKLWDATWDEMSDPFFSHIPYDKWHELGTFNLTEHYRNVDNEITIKPTTSFKWAGWMDLYNKNMWVDFWTYHKDWKGYGACDFYTMTLAQECKKLGIDIQQYLVTGMFTYPYWMNKDLQGFVEYYKNRLTFNDIPNQREEFDLVMGPYLNKNLEYLFHANSK